LGAGAQLDFLIQNPFILELGNCGKGCKTRRSYRRPGAKLADYWDPVRSTGISFFRTE
jgi:hypothetical protein